MALDGLPMRIDCRGSTNDLIHEEAVARPARQRAGDRRRRRLPLVIGSAGLASDTIQWALWKRQLQRAADSAAIAGVYAKIAGQDATDTATTSRPRPRTTSRTTGPLLSRITPIWLSEPADAGTMRPRTRSASALSIQKRLSFSRMFLATRADDHARHATAAIVPSGEYCVVSLGEHQRRPASTRPAAPTSTWAAA